MNNYTLYKHTSPSNKVYIGITKLDVKLRWRNGTGYQLQPRFYNAIKKYGWDNFSHEIIFRNLDEDEAKLLEQMYIALYESTDPSKGYNISQGGESASGYVRTNETNLKSSESHKRRLENNNEEKDRISAVLYYNEHKELTNDIIKTYKKSRNKHINKFILVTDKGFSPVFYTVKSAMWFLYNTHYTKRMKRGDLKSLNDMIFNRLRGNAKYTTPLPIKYTKNIPIYVIPLNDEEYKYFAGKSEYNWFNVLRNQLEAGKYKNIFN